MYQNIRHWYRYYFVRKKSPLSWIFWGDILRRQLSWQGSYQVSIAAAGEPDCAISLSKGAPHDNKVIIAVYDTNEKLVETVEIPLSYRSMVRVIDGFNKASAISRRTIKAEGDR